MAGCQPAVIDLVVPPLDGVAAEKRLLRGHDRWEARNACRGLAMSLDATADWTRLCG